MSSSYWRKREQDWKNSNKKSEEEYIKEIQKIYLSELDLISKEIESFFSRYASKEKITMTDAKKKARKIDIEEYKRKAKKYVEEKDFSDQANEEMRLYNLTMKVNRLELLKANIGLELVNGSNDLETYFGEKLDAEVMAELERNAAILGPSVLNNAKSALVAVNSSFQNATWSERVWNNQAVLKNNLTNIISNALIQGKNARDFIPDIRKQFDVSRYQAERLLRTELARARVQAQAESYAAEDIDEYEYVACGMTDCCSVCKKLDGKIFKLKKLEFGVNAPPMHPNCHCATAPYLDRKEFDEWLDGYSKHGLTFEEWKSYKDTSGQAYRALNKGAKQSFTMNRSSGLTEVTTRKLESYNTPVYLSEKAKMSRRDIHVIQRNTAKAYDKYQFSSLAMPTIVIVDQEELSGAFGLYDCVTNTVYYNSDIANKEGMAQNGGTGITEYHEMWHAKQADDFAAKGYTFTEENRNEYIRKLRKLCKKRIDELEITIDNANEISKYAKSSYALGNWDEVEAEYHAYYRRR